MHLSSLNPRKFSQHASALVFQCLLYERVQTTCLDICGNLAIPLVSISFREPTANSLVVLV